MTWDFPVKLGVPKWLIALIALILSSIPLKVQNPDFLSNSSETFTWELTKGGASAPSEAVSMVLPTEPMSQEAMWTHTLRISALWIPVGLILAPGQGMKSWGHFCLTPYSTLAPMHYVRVKNMPMGLPHSVWVLATQFLIMWAWPNFPTDWEWKYQC